MKFTIAKKSLYPVLSSVSRAASHYSPLPILSGIKFTLKDDVLTLIASDSNISIKESIVADNQNQLRIEEEGEIVLESRYVLEAVRKIENEFISFAIIDGALTKISAGNTEYTINGSKANLYPNIDFTKPDNEFRIKGSLLSEIITQTAFVCANSDDRPIFTGVNFKMDGDILNCIATDSYRLAKKTVAISVLNPFNVCIPAANLHEVQKSIKEQEDVLIALNTRIIQFYIGHTLIQSRLIDGLFPDVNRLIPHEFGFELVVDRDEMIAALDRSSFLKSDGYWTIKLEASPGKVLLTTKAQEIGSSEEIIVPLDYKGGHLKISFSGRYMIEALRSFKTDTIHLYFVHEMSGFILRDINDDSIIQLILPVKTFD